MTETTQCERYALRLPRVTNGLAQVNNDILQRLVNDADRLQRAEELLRAEIKPYMDNLADAECFTDSPNPRPNEEMRLLTEINEVLGES